MTGLAAGPAVDVPALLALCKTRILEREGIPMFVALDDARPGRALDVHDEVGLAEGARLAALFDHYERGLARVEVATETDDPTGAAALIDVLVVLSDQHLRARPEPGQ